GLANFEPYRDAQTVWLRNALARPEIASAPFVVVFCHIPLWGRAGENGGDTLEGYAAFCRQAQRAWHPVLAEHKIHLLVCGHMHEFRYDAPTEERSYPQIVGGGPKLNIATLIRGKADAKELEVTAYSLDKKVLGSWKFSPRSV
ncbi:MAG TPA: metallophosphoesterase family protein, partial [Pirellulales bacterium]